MGPRARRDLTHDQKVSTSAEAVLDHVVDGDDVIVPLASGEPVSLVDALEVGAETGRFRGVRVHQMHALHDRPYLHGRMRDRLLHVSCFLEANVRMPRTFRRNQIHVSQLAGWTEVDRPLVEVVPPAPSELDDQGRHRHEPALRVSPREPGGRAAAGRLRQRPAGDRP
jgi:hypothetical protein